MSGEIRVLQGTSFRRVGTINPGENLYIRAGAVICIETWALDWAQHDFQYEVNSRQTVQGVPEAIATTRSALQNEFVERRVVTRMPIPVSVGDSNRNHIPEINLTMGEVSPQIYRSRLNSSPLAWSIKFKYHRSVGAGGNVGAVRNATKRNPSAPMVA